MKNIQLATETESNLCDVSTNRKIGTLDDMRKAVGSSDSGDSDGEPKYGTANEESSDTRYIVAGSVTLEGDGEADKVMDNKVQYRKDKRKTTWKQKTIKIERK